jgi:SrtB family sortase
MDDLNEKINDLLGENEQAESDELERLYGEYAADIDRNTLPEAQLSDDVYNDIIKNTSESAVYEEKTTRRLKYQGAQSFVDVENPYQTDREKPQDEQLEKYADFSDEAQTGEKVKTFDEIFKGIAKKLFPNKSDSKKEFARKLIADISVVTLVGCAIAFGIIFTQSHQAKKQQKGISKQVIEISSAEQEEKMWEEFRAKYPNIVTPDGMSAKYAYLYALNQQLVGWVSIPNSGVDVQVVQSPNNSDYLKKDFYGNYSRYGCPFMDYRNDAKYLNQNTIIYGHHMSDGLIFAELSKYKKLEGFLESPVIKFDTLYDTYYFKIYAVIITNSREQDDNGYVFNYTVTSFGSEENFKGYIDALDERKLYTTGVDINAADKLISLSTCTYEFTDARLVIIGRMLRTGETTDIDTTFAVTNGSPHYPQVWYDAKGISNPYASSERWYPEQINN